MPGHAEAWHLRGQAHAALRHHLAAAEDFARAIAATRAAGRTPEPDAWLDRARMLESAGPAHLAAALGALDEGMAVLGPIVGLQIPAIDLEVALGHYDVALARVDRLASSAARPEARLARRSEILERAGRLAEARLASRQALEAIDALPAPRREAPALVLLRRDLQARLDRLLDKTEATAPKAGR